MKSQKSIADGRNSEATKTRVSLLGRLRSDPHDEQSWNEFVEKYGKLLLVWCHRWGLPWQDAEDVVQNVLVELARLMREFRYDESGSFRGWLRTIAYRAWCDACRSKMKAKVQPKSEVYLEMLSSTAACHSFLEQMDLQARQDQLAAAMEVVKLRVEPHTWKAFELTALQGQSGEDVGRELGMNAATVYVAKSKVIRQIREIMGQDF